MKLSLYNKIIKSIQKGLNESRLFDNNDDLFDNNDELTLDELNIAENISDYVDLGLPSGTLWCKHNVGAKQPEEYGDYFTFDEANEKYNNIPTKELFQELIDKCEWKWSLLNAVKGYKVAGKNKEYIFLPAAGNINNLMNINSLSVKFSGKYGLYWSSSLVPSDVNDAYYLYFGLEFINPPLMNYRCRGYLIRPVKHKKS